MNPLLITTAEATSDKNPLIALTPGLYIWTIITFLLSEKAKLELERLNEESEKIMAKARVEAQEILAEGKATAEKVKEDTISKAKEAANKIREDAEKQIQVEKEKAITDIKNEVVEISISVAEKLINKNLSDADNKALVDESLKKVKKYEA